MHIKPCHSTPIGCERFLAWTMAPPQRGMGSDTAWDFSALCLSLSYSRLFKHWPKATVDKQSESIWVRNRLCVQHGHSFFFIHARHFPHISVWLTPSFQNAEFGTIFKCPKYRSLFTLMAKRAMAAWELEMKDPLSGVDMLHVIWCYWIFNDEDGSQI